MHTTRITCFIIDDEQPATRRLTQMLEILTPNWEVKGFTSCRELITEYKKNPPEVLFLDVEMPAMTGFELLEKLHADGFQPTAILVTGFEHYAIKAIKEKVFDYVMKPIDIEELKKTVSRITDSLFTPAIIDRIEILGILTKTERKVLKLLSTGLTSKEVAYHLNQSLNTINTHRSHILSKMGCKSFVEVLDKIERGH